MNTKIYYYLIGTLVVGIIGVLVFQTTPSQIKETTIPVVIDTGAIINTGIIDSGSLVTGTQKNSLVYTNTEYGFQLTLPEGWEEYKVFFYPASKELQKFYNGYVGGIKIAIPTNESRRYGIEDPTKPSLNGNTDTYIKGYAEMFNIIIWTPEGYKKEQQRCTPNPDPSCIGSIELLGNNQSYYFTYSGPGDMPTDLYPIRGSGEYISKIISTFKGL